MQRSEILNWLRETDHHRLEDLWQLADRTRREYVGDEVHLRGLLELSNHCVRLCMYCGLRAANAALRRYRMSDDEVLRCAHRAVKYGYGTVVLQSGEDPLLSGQRVGDLIRRIKAETPLAVTLSLGERTDEELAEWRRAGADRYLLRFETSNRELYERIHPPRSDEAAQAQNHNIASNSRGLTAPGRKSCETRTFRGLLAPGYCEKRFQEVPRRSSTRLEILGTLRELGHEVGSGVMIGIPGQTFDDLADDVELFGRLDLDMVGVGPYLPHPGTPLADRGTWPAAVEGQVPADEITTCKVIALTRLVCPKSNIPATTALATLDHHRGREMGLLRGANVIMPNVTPRRYRLLYEIYPDKACFSENPRESRRSVIARIEALGRRPGVGRGDSPNYRQRMASIEVYNTCLASAPHGGSGQL